LNVVLIVADSLRRDHVGCYGTRAKTPYLDRLAAESIVFDEHHAASFPTGPHRQDLHTGRYTFPYQSWSGVADDDVSLGRVLKQTGVQTLMSADTPAVLRAGYPDDYDHTKLIPHWNNPTAPDPIGVEYSLPAAPQKLRNPERVYREMQCNAERRTESDWFCGSSFSGAAELMEQHAHSGPFFLYVDTFDPHEPWFPPPWYVEQYDPGYTGERIIEPAYEPVADIDGITDREIQHLRALYAATVTMVDAWIGYLLWTIDRLNLKESTAVIVTTDHGFYLADHGLLGKVHLNRDDRIISRYPLYAEMTRTPLLMRIPGTSPGRSSAITQPPDIMPTILSLMGIAPPDTVQGQSLFDANGKPIVADRDWAVSSYTMLQDEECRTPAAYRNTEWTYLVGGDEAPAALYRNDDDPYQLQDMAPDRPDVLEQLHAAYLEALGTIDCPEERIAARRDRGRRPKTEDGRIKLI
jgi:arylsulfatase A-like enzyme